MGKESAAAGAQSIGFYDDSGGAGVRLRDRHEDGQGVASGPTCPGSSTW